MSFICRESRNELGSWLHVIIILRKIQVIIYLAFLKFFKIVGQFSHFYIKRQFCIFDDFVTENGYPINLEKNIIE